MKTVSDRLREVQDEQGWTDTTLLDLLLEYMNGYRQVSTIVTDIEKQAALENLSEDDE